MTYNSKAASPDKAGTQGETASNNQANITINFNFYQIETPLGATAIKKFLSEAAAEGRVDDKAVNYMIKHLGLKGG